MKPPDNLGWLGLLLCPAPSLFSLGWHLHGRWVGGRLRGIYPSVMVTSPAGILWDGSLHGVSNETFGVQAYCNLSHTCSTLSHTWNTLWWVLSIYGHPKTFCPGSFTPLCLPLLCLPALCWAGLFYKACCCSGLHLRWEAWVTSALCPLPSDSPNPSKSSSCSSHFPGHWDLVEDLQGGSFRCLSSFARSFSQPHRIVISFWIGKMFLACHFFF